MNNGNVNNDDKTNDNNNYARCVHEHEFTFKQLHDAYLACRKRKRNTINALKFEVDLECNLDKLVYDLNFRNYVPARSVCFTITKPKPREIFAADFKDRIVHHVLFDYLNPIFEKIFIYDSFACRKNKGTLASVQRLQKFTRSITQNGKKRAYFLQLDIHNFFMSIDKEILYAILEKKIKRDEMLWLAKILLFHDPTENYLQKSPKSVQKTVPYYKSLIHRPKTKGLPIGNLTSQFFANVYLNELDQFIKHKLKAKYYVRYVDDFVLLSDSKDELLKWQEEIKNFLRTKLLLQLKSNIILRPISNGINFVGYVIKPNYLLPRNRNINTIISKIKYYENQCISVKEKMFILNYAKIPLLAKSLNSYFGHVRYSKCKYFYDSLIIRFPFLRIFFLFWNYKITDYFNNDYQVFYTQYAFFKKYSKNAIIFLQIGDYYRVLNEDAVNLSSLFDYELKSSVKYIYLDFPKQDLNLVLDELTPRQKVAMTIKENSESGLMKRILDCIYVPNYSVVLKIV